MRLWLTVVGLLAFAVVGFAIIWWFFAISLGERQLANCLPKLVLFRCLGNPSSV